jgi:NTP pyrophosphatase (non-canonical NTP hydrolase)
VKDAQRQVDEWISQFEEGYWPPLANLARLMEEVGELARLINHSYGSKPKKPEEVHQEMSEELADVLFVILCMANEQGIDLDEAFERVLAKYRSRDGERWAKKVEEDEPPVL